MIKIIALFGPSGCGKDTLLKYIVEHNTINKIVNCTTRPKREYEKDGTHYHFLSNEDFTNKVINGQMIEATEFNHWFYGTSIEDLREDVINIGVFNIHALECLSNNKDIELYPIYIACENKTRLLRSLNREQKPNCEEICRRFLTDNQDFNQELHFEFLTYYNGNNVPIENFQSFINDNILINQNRLMY